ADVPRPALDIFLDEDWHRADSVAPCSRAQDVPARRSHSFVEVGRDGKWGRWEGGSLFQNVRPHIWYFALADCKDNVVEGHQQGTYKVDYEVRWKQFDDSELSLELRYMPAATLLVLACLTVLFVRLAWKCRELRRDLGRLHPVVFALAAAMGLQWWSQALHLVHLRAYSQNGVGAHFTDTVADILFMLSQVASATLLIAIAQGYTIVRSKLNEVELLTPVVTVVVVVHVALVAVGKLQGEAHYKYHENEGMIGWILLSVRISLLAWFRSGIQKLRSAGGLRLQSFLQSFELAGCAYFLAYPVIFIVVQLFAPYLQHPLLQTGLLAMQTASWLWLADLFLSRGSYFQVSELSASLLPGADGSPRCYSPTNCFSFSPTSWQKAAGCKEA
ncbi:unnamed protein product, partial [Polarella glacialis]